MQTRTIGTYRKAHFHAGRIDPVAADVDLLIVGMPERSRETEGGVSHCTLDAALAGTLTQLRAGGLFGGRLGETMILSSPPPPVRCRSLLIIGMGEIDHVDPGRLGLLSAIAMRTTLQLDSRSIACLLALPDPSASAKRLGYAARAMMIGALDAIDSHPRSDRSTVMDWTFDLRAEQIDETASLLQAVIAQWPTVRT